MFSGISQQTVAINVHFSNIHSRLRQVKFQRGNEAGIHLIREGKTILIRNLKSFEELSALTKTQQKHAALQPLSFPQSKVSPFFFLLGFKTAHITFRLSGIRRNIMKYEFPLPPNAYRIPLACLYARWRRTQKTAQGSI